MRVASLVYGSIFLENKYFSHIFQVVGEHRSVLNILDSLLVKLPIKYQQRAWSRSSAELKSEKWRNVNQSANQQVFNQSQRTLYVHNTPTLQTDRTDRTMVPQHRANRYLEQSVKICSNDAHQFGESAQSGESLEKKNGYRQQLLGAYVYMCV